jgi:hypothetical protein
MILLVDRSDHEMIWLPDGDEVPDREKHMIQNPKLMLTFVWNPHEFQVVDAMQQERCSRPPTISEIFSLGSLLGVERGKRMLVVHMDNARSHTAKATRAFCNDNFLRIAAYPPFSPDLTLRDFFLFEHLKNCLQGQQFGSGDEFFSRVRKFLNEISVDILKTVFRE